jgi:hypothetical protein
MYANEESSSSGNVTAKRSKLQLLLSKTATSKFVLFQFTLM